MGGGEGERCGGEGETGREGDSKDRGEGGGGKEMREEGETGREGDRG